MDTPKLYTPDNESEGEPSPVGASEHGSPHVWALVERLVDAGEWPTPDLVKQIVDAGDAATEPLLAILRGDLRGISEDATVRLAIGILSMSTPLVAIPALVDIVKTHDEDTAEDAGCALGDFGAPGFDALIELCRDPSITGYVPYFLTTAAIIAAGVDPLRKSVIAEILRERFDARIALARERLKLDGKLAKYSPGDFDDVPEMETEFDDPDEDDSDEDDSDEPVSYTIEGPIDETDQPRVEPEIAESIGFLVGDLALLRDESARELIETAYQEGLVDEVVTSKASVDELYQSHTTLTSDEADPGWFESYKELYTDHLTIQSQEANSPPKYPGDDDPWDEDEDDEDAEPVAVTEPIRNVGPKLGRNDPCWCGSGKKYKKCHLSQREPV